MAQNSIERLTQARKALAEAKSLDDILEIRDIAEAARTYARAAQLGLESQNEAAEIKIRAERKAGELLKQMPKAEGTRGQLSGGNIVLPPEDAPTYADLGIEKMQAHRWQAIASLPQDEFERHIAERRSEGEELTSAGVIREYKTIQRLEMHENKRTMDFPVGKYSVIYADPPWKYNNSGFDEAADGQYPTMELQEICELPIHEMSTNTSVLFLWATNPLLPEALEVVKSWGFEYKTNIAWIKDAGRGKGWFLKSKHELLLIGTKKETPHPQIRPDSCFEAMRGSIHSRKPKIAYEIIEKMYPGSKIELFARTGRDGWDAWGNEV